MDVTRDSIAAHTGGTFGTRLLARNEYDSLLYTVGVFTENKQFLFLYSYFIWVLCYRLSRLLIGIPSQWYTHAFLMNRVVLYIQW